MTRLPDGGTPAGPRAVAVRPGLEPGALRPRPAPASGPARVLAQVRFDVAVLLRNGEQLLLTVLLPLLVLVGMTRVRLVDLGPGPRIDQVTPGVIALAVVSTALTGQAISTGFDRRYGVLRLLGTTPLGRGGLLAGRMGAVLTLVTLQGVILGGTALVMGWRPALLGIFTALAATFWGCLTFVAVGLLLAGVLRAEAVLAVANLLWVLLLAGGGLVVAPEQMGALGQAAAWLPSAALGDLLRRAATDGGLDLGALVILSAWGLAATAAALRWFRWD